MRTKGIVIALAILILGILTPSGDLSYHPYLEDNAQFADDGAAPVISLLSPANGSVVKPFSLIDIDITDNVAVSHVLYHWDLIANETFEIPYDLYARTSEVGHYLYVYANDTSGTWTKAMFYFVSDGTSPEINLATPTNNSVQLSGTDINATVTDVHLTDVYYSWDEIEILNIWSEPYSIQLISGDGTHTLHVYANDSAGNWIEANFVLITDDNAPIINLRDLTNGTARQSGSVIDIDILDASTNTVLYNWNSDSQNTTWIEPYQTVLPNGETLHTLKVYANDTFGRWQHEVFQFIGDNTPPELLLVSPTNESLHFSGTEVTISVTDIHLSSVYYNWDDTVYQVWTGATLIPSGDGIHILKIFSNDSAENFIVASCVFDVDDSPPAVVGPDDFESDFYGVGIFWAVVDAHPASYIVLVNGTLAESGSWHSGGLVFEIPGDFYLTTWPHVWNCTIIFTDSLGSSTSDTVMLTVVGPPPPTDYPVIDNGLIAYYPLIIAGCAAVPVVLAIFMLKREGVFKSN